MNRQIIREHLVNRSEQRLAQWHRLMQHVTFGAALGLMAASYVSLHWALDLVTGNAVVAYTVPVVLEAGMAATAAVASSKRRPDGRYYINLWLIFGFVMLLSQGANIGHAMVVVEPRMGELPAFIPASIVYGFAAAFAALFPLGGPMFVHVSGFIRAHSVDADWVDDDAQVVRVATDSAPVRARAPKAPNARLRADAATNVKVAQAPEKMPANMPATPAVEINPEREAAYQRYAADRREGRQEWTTRRTADECGVASAPQGSRIRTGWRDRYEQEQPQERRDLHLAEPATTARDTRTA